MGRKGKDVIEASAGRTWNFTPELLFYFRLIQRAEIDCMAAQRFACPYLPGAEASPLAWEIWDTAIMSRDWIRRPSPDPKLDREGYLLSFDHCCHVLGLSPDYERTWLLQRVDAAVDFDCDEVWARVEYLAENPPDESREPLFDAPRCVPALDQGCLFAMEAM